MWSYMHGTAVLLLVSTNSSIASPVGSLTTPISVGEPSPEGEHFTIRSWREEEGGGRGGTR